jgi:two-component system chemotaxis response regulator CheB
VSEHINVLVVDDSAFMRRAITKMLESEPDIRVVATARTGEEAISKSQQTKPDVITMDVEMPGMGGLEAVRQIVSTQSVPIIMVSSLTREGAETTFRALDMGAVDFIAKPDSAYANITDVARDLVTKIRTFARRGAHPLSAQTVTERAQPPSGARSSITSRVTNCVAIGTSTGGPVALAHVIPRLPADFPTPIVIVQHMPVGFTRPLAERLNSLSQLRVVEAADGMLLKAGMALVVPSGKQIALRRSLGNVEVRLVPDDSKSLHVPSVDALATEVAEIFGAGAVGVIMTGMGQDGIKGLRDLKNRGGYVVGQDEETCVVYGMPRAAAKAGLVDRVVPLDHIAPVLCDLAHVANS